MIIKGGFIKERKQQLWINALYVKVQKRFMRQWIVRGLYIFNRLGLLKSENAEEIRLILWLD
jgi:hypothetical protein